MKAIKNFIQLEGMTKWELARDSGMSFKADEWNGKVDLQFSMNNPSDAHFKINLRSNEARKLAGQLLNAAVKCEKVKA